MSIFNFFKVFKTPIPKIGAIYAGPMREFASDRRDYWRVMEIGRSGKRVKLEQVGYFGKKGNRSPARSPRDVVRWPIVWLRNFELLSEDQWDEFDTF